MSSNKDKKEQEPQTEEIKEEKVETAAEEIKDEAKAEPKEEKTEKKHKKESKKEAEIKETAEKLIQAEKEKYLRLCAEYDNFRKRSQKERDGLYCSSSFPSTTIWKERSPRRRQTKRTARAWK